MTNDSGDNELMVVGTSREMIPAAKELRAKRQRERTAEDYLRPILRSSQYIDSVSKLLETAANEMKQSRLYKDFHEEYTKTHKLGDLTPEEKNAFHAINGCIPDAINSSIGMRQGLECTDRLFRNDGILASTDMRYIASMQSAVGSAQRTLEFIASQIPNSNNGLSEDTISDAEAVLKVMETHLGGIFAGDNRVAQDRLKNYNDEYTKRMAAVSISTDRDKEIQAAGISGNNPREKRKTYYKQSREAAAEELKHPEMFDKKPRAGEEKGAEGKRSGWEKRNGTFGEEIKAERAVEKKSEGVTP